MKSVNFYFLIIGLFLILGFQSAEAEFSDDITENFNELQEIQSEFNNKISGLENGDITSEEFLDFSPSHIRDMENLILKFNQLRLPQEFVLAVELLKSSIQTQLDSDKNYIKFIETGDQSYEQISNDLLQKAFLEESDGIARYNQALEEHSHEEDSYSTTGTVSVSQGEIVELKNKIHDLEAQLEEKDRIIEEKNSVLMEQVKVIQNLASKIQKTILESVSIFVDFI